ncbi:DDE superfamily endonuclease [Popillia japonica]|uniref:DDE superfamily endonuclease n=1 Tax=Popillia japonica TaxID=7064 RepID=A0AAW1N0Q9_POPJA
MDSHASHVSPETLKLAANNDIHIVTFPAHRTHITQPLDGRVYKSLKSNWKRGLDNFMRNNPREKPSRVDFNRLLKPVWHGTFQPLTIIHSFEKTGIFPINTKAIPDEALAPSLIIRAFSDTDSNRASTPRPPVMDKSTLLEIPVSVKDRKVLPEKSLAKVISPSVLDVVSSCSISGFQQPSQTSVSVPSSSLNKPSRSGCQKSFQHNKVSVTRLSKCKATKDWFCGSCGSSYNEDVLKKNGAKWIQCSLCLVWYHCQCQNITDEVTFMCDACAAGNQNITDEVTFMCDACAAGNDSE